MIKTYELTIDEIIISGTYEEWINFENIINKMPMDYVISILEHYDLENWL